MKPNGAEADILRRVSIVSLHKKRMTGLGDECEAREAFSGLLNVRSRLRPNVAAASTKTGKEVNLKKRKEIDRVERHPM